MTFNLYILNFTKKVTDESSFLFALVAQLTRWLDAFSPTLADFDIKRVSQR